MEEKTIDTSETQNEVKQEWETTWLREKFEVSKEDYEKLNELNHNKTIALKQERDAHKLAMEKLSEFEREKKELEEKEMKKKGKYEELLAEKEKLIEELKDKASKFDEYLTEKEKKQETKINELTWKLSEEVLKEYSDIFEDLNTEKKIKFLEKLVNNNKKETFDPELKNGQSNPNNKENIDINNAKKGWFDSFLNAMIKSNVQ